MVADKTFVGFGMGPIQAGLFALEAFRSGRFGRIVIAEIVPELVAQIRAADGRFAVNVAHAERIEVSEVGPVEILNPNEAADREVLIEAIAEANEVAGKKYTVQHMTHPENPKGSKYSAYRDYGRFGNFFVTVWLI